MHRQTQNHIYAILINSFLLLFHGKKKEKKRRNMFTIFLQTNFYPKKKMASWLSGFVDASCKILWKTFSRGLLKHFSLDIFVEYDKVALTILCGFSHVSALTFPLFRDQRCGSGTCCHVSTLQMSSYGILSILFPRWGPCGETKKNKEIGIRRVREFFHQEKRTEVLFSLSKNISQMKTN